MRRTRRALMACRPSAATVIAFTALIAVLSGTAYAAGTIGSSQLQNGAVTSAKIKPGAVKTSKLADGAVTSRKLSPSARSQGFASTQAGQLSLPPATDTIVARLSVPAGGRYILSAAVDLGSAGAGGLVSCQLLENNNPIATGNANLPPLAVFSQTISLTAPSSGGAIQLVCNPDTGSQAKSRVIDAIRLGSLATQ
jgi:hypothetical protein